MSQVERCPRCQSDDPAIDLVDKHGIPVTAQRKFRPKSYLCPDPFHSAQVDKGAHPCPACGTITYRDTSSYSTYQQRIEERERALNVLLDLILVKMRVATNQDLACDGPVGDEEGKVWAEIEDFARTTRSTLTPKGDDG